MSTPNVTPAQLLALVASVIGLLISQGAITNNTGKQLVGIAAIAIPIAIALADAVIRHGRAGIVAAQAQAISSAPVPPPSGAAAVAATAAHSAKPRKRSAAS